MKTNFYKSYVLALLFFGASWSSLWSAEEAEWPFSLTCPANVTVSCTANLSNLSQYGTAMVMNGHHTYPAGTPTVTYNLSSCNVGTILRTWMVEDMNWNWHSCTQTITVTRPNNAPPTIYWPADVTLNGCNPNINPYTMSGHDNYPTWDHAVCSMLGRSYSDMEFYVNSQCKKIMRTWKVLDWCDYSPHQGYKIYQRVQTIFIMESTPPDLVCPAEITVNSFNCKDADLVAHPLTVHGSACGGQFHIINNSKFAVSSGANISGKYPIGKTKVTYTVRYGCGLTRTCHTDVIVLNGATPTPYCIREITTSLMPLDTDNDGKVDNGMVEIEARRFNHGSFSSCGYNPLRFSFSSDVNDTKRILTCDHVGKNEMEVWVTDSRGGQNFCNIIVNVQNNAAQIPDCQPKPVVVPPPPYSVAGDVTTITDRPLSDVRMKLEYLDSLYTYNITYDTIETLELDSFINHSGFKLYFYNKTLKITQSVDSVATFIERFTLTDTLGKYVFDSLPLREKPVKISGEYADDARRFIDSKDVELLTKFLLGEVTFMSYPQFLASDVNEDGVINNTDLTLLMDFVNGVTNELPGDNAWYVLDKKATFTNPEDVLTSPLPVYVFLDSVSLVQQSVPFVAIKKGNISIEPGNFKDVEISVRNQSTSDISVVAYPNPFRNQLNFEVNAPNSGKSVLLLYNASGQNILTQNVELAKGENVFAIDLNHLTTGLIIYKWVINEETITGKVIKTE